MAFTTLNFWLLFPFIFAIFWLIPYRKTTLRNIYLLLLGYVLYALWKPVFLIVLIWVTLSTYFGALSIEVNGDSRKRKQKMILFLLLSLLPLTIFKYYNFLNENISVFFDSLGIRIILPGLNWAIPVGLSFYTFQSLSYLLDVYYGKVKAEKSVVDYALFVSFFPQVMSGPISKASELLPQIKAYKPFDYNIGKEGLKFLLWGMFLKLVLADRLGLCVDNIYSRYEHLSGITLFGGSIFYTIQIYADFAGYSYMAMGIARLLNINLINNFNQPYFSNSISDFWRRWHISLSRWLKDYVYIPMGGSHCSKIKNYWNILITFFVSGIWHGANWNFILWGGVHGLVQVIEKILGLNKTDKVKWLRIPLTFLIVNFAWILFYNTSLSQAFDFMGKMFTTPGGFDLGTVGFTSLLLITVSTIILLIRDIRAEWWHFRINKYMYYVVYVLLFCMILSVGVLDSSTFIYQNF